MAKFYPDTIKHTAQAGEKRLFRVLQEALQDRPDWIVWFEPQILARKTDFIVWSPEIGLLLLEVKDYSPRYVVQTTPEVWFLRGGGPRKNPAVQAWEAKCLLLDTLKANPALRSIHPMRSSDCAFPVNHAVVLTGMTRIEAEETNCLGTLPLDCGVFFKDDLSADFSFATERGRFVRLLTEERKYVRAVELHPDDVAALEQMLFPVYGNPLAGRFWMGRFAAALWAGRFGLRRILLALWAGVLRRVRSTGRRRPRRRARKRTAGRAWVVLVLLLVFAWIAARRYRPTVRAARAPVVDGLSLTVTPTHVHAGQRAVLRWSSYGATRVVLDGYVVAAAGTVVLFPEASQVHRLQVTRANGRVVATTVRVMVVGRSR